MGEYVLDGISNLVKASQGRNECEWLRPKYQMQGHVVWCYRFKREANVFLANLTAAND